MAIEKVYSLDITKGRCKDSDEWEIHDVKAKHVGYSPLESIKETTNPLLVTTSGITYECDEYFDKHLTSQYSYGVYVYNSKFVNGGASKPKLIYGAGNDLDIPEEISEKYLATEDNPNVPFVKNIMSPCGGCPFVLTDYGVFSACDTYSTLFNYDGSIHTDNVMFNIGQSILFKSNGMWNAQINGEYIFDDTFTLITAYGSEDNCNSYKFFYNKINGEVVRIEYVNSSGESYYKVMTTLQTGLTRYNEESLAPILKDNNNNTYFFNIDNSTLERIDDFIEYNNGIIFKDKTIKYRTNKNDTYYVIVPNDFDIEKFKEKIIKIEYIPRKWYMKVLYYENPIGMFFVDNDGLIDIYLYHNNIIYECKNYTEHRIKTNDFKFLGFDFEYAGATNADRSYPDYCYIFISSDNTLFTIYNYTCYPSITGNNYSKLVTNNLYNSTDNKWYNFTWGYDIDVERFRSIATLDIEPIGETEILGNIYEIYPQFVWVNGEYYQTDEYGYLFKTKNYSIVPKITFKDLLTFNEKTTTNYYDYYMEYGYNEYNSYKPIAFKCLPKYYSDYIDDTGYAEFPIYNNIIPNGIFYGGGFDDLTIIHNSNDILTFGDFSFYNAEITNCYAKNIKLGFKSFADYTYNVAPIIHAPYGADYSNEYINHPSWYKPTYDLIPIDEYTKTLKFEFSGDSVDVEVDGVTKTFTSSPVEVEVEHSWSVNAGSSTITKYCTIPFNYLSKQDSSEYVKFIGDPEIIDGTELNKYTFSKKTTTAFGNKQNTKEIIWNGFIKLNNNLNEFISNCGNLEKVYINDMKFVKEGNNSNGSYGYFTLNVVDMINECPNLKNVSMDGWDIENMIVTGCPFNNTLTSLETVSMKNWNAKNTTFNNCLFSSGLTSLQTIDLRDSSSELYRHIAKCLDDNNLSNVKVILNSNSTPSNETLKISFSGDNISFKLNNKTYNTIYNPYTTTLTDMGIVQLRNCKNAFDSSSLTDIISFPDTSFVIDMSNMFRNCNNLTSLDLSGWDVSNVTNMSGMFDGCSGLTSIDLSGWDVSNVTKMSSMFYDCDSLTTLNLSGWDVSNVTKMGSMFSDCDSLTSLDLSGWNTSNVTSVGYMFAYCDNLTSLNLSGWDISNVTDITYMFDGCKSLTSLILNDCKIGNIEFEPFYHFIEDFSTIDTSNVTDMTYMFRNCRGLTSLDLSSWDVSNVTNMYYMFKDCNNLTSLDLSGWDVSNVTNMARMFDYCSGLTSLDLSSWGKSSVTTMGAMFYECRNLTSLNLSNFDTSNVTEMGNMFFDCKGLTSLDLSGWDVSNVTDMNRMFGFCNNLTSLDLSGWDISNVTKMNTMFDGCTSLQTLKVKQGTRDKWYSNLSTTLQNQVTIIEV